MGSQANDAGCRVALLIRNTLHRYAVEGMIHSLSGSAPVRPVDPGGESVNAYDGRRFDVLLAASADLEADTVREAVRVLCVQGPRLLLLVDGPDALDAPWIAACRAQGLLDWVELEPRRLADALADVTAGKFHVSSSLAHRLVTLAGRTTGAAPTRVPVAPALTPRELQVLRLVAEGLSNKQVSHRLLISEHGVKRLMGNVLAKLNCPNRTLAVVRAMDDGLLAV
ncbi:LuxR C-terminal-related transcriptional regulator [Streptomyces sp. NBC_01390]|uniref:helix-turn-helix transcriptional regulator n=1 Tax=Streptomyces sp. NBC_01390 TaxID=2903850 RepID=UPI003247B4A6